MACAKAQLGLSWGLGETGFLSQRGDCTRTSGNGETQVEMADSFGWVRGERSEARQGSRGKSVYGCGRGDLCLLGAELDHCLCLGKSTEDVFVR